jgi:hypothetical protein
MKHEPIQDAWKTRNKLYFTGYNLSAAGGKLRAEGDDLRFEGYNLRVEGDKLRVEGDKLLVEGDKLIALGCRFRVEGSDFYRAAVLAKYGPTAVIDWETGEIETN